MWEVKNSMAWRITAALLSGPLEPTNQWYAIAKITGIKLAQAYRRQYGRDFISAMPTNLFGPGDNFDLEKSHVLPALIRKVHEAKVQGRHDVTIWGTGTPRREFLHADDLADALAFALQHRQLSFGMKRHGRTSKPCDPRRHHCRWQGRRPV